MISRKVLAPIIIILLSMAFLYIGVSGIINHPFHDECQALQDKGYFENRADIAAHEDCPEVKPYGQQCNQERWDTDKDLRYYGRYCTWMSLGYIQFLGYLMLILMGLFCFVPIFISIKHFIEGFHK